MSETGFGFKKRSVKQQFARKRKESSEEEKKSSDEEPSSSVVRPDIKGRFNPNVQSTKAIKRMRKKRDSDDSDSDSSGSDVVVSYKSKRSAQRSGPQDQGATAQVEIETEQDRDAVALFKKQQEINEDLAGKEDDKKYRGMNNYATFFKKKDNALGNAGSGFNSVGPMRAPAHIRTTVRWDYQPDICKDFKETGFCGFGGEFKKLFI
jgi:RING finger protein 113A